MLFHLGSDGAGGVAVGGFWIALYLLLGLLWAAVHWHRHEEATTAACVDVVRDLRHDGATGPAAVALGLTALCTFVSVGLAIVGWPADIAARAAIRLRRRAGPHA